MVSDDSKLTARYPSDLSDEEWEILKPILEEIDPYTLGRPRKSDRREILNAIFYLNKTGCPWRYLPKDFPTQKLVNYYYNKWTDNRLLEKVNTTLRQRLRKKRAEPPAQRGPSSIARASRTPRNPRSHRGSMGASLSRGESGIL